MRMLTCGILVGIGLTAACSPTTERPAKDNLPEAQTADAGRAPSAPLTATDAGAEPPAGMLAVPGGTFTMGQDDRGMPDERPAHPVTVDAFYLDRTEVTVKAYLKCVRAGVCRPHMKLAAGKSGFEPDAAFRTPTRPISGVSHSDAQTYCEWVSKRLPTEAEWERAARGDDARRFPWGDEWPTGELAVFRARVTQPVGSKPKGAGPYGHLDLAGNVWEWVADRYDPYAYRRSSASVGIPGSCDEILATQNQLRRMGRQGFTGTNPIPTECEFVLRGGAFNYFPWGLRSMNRVHHPGRFRMVMAGFRCAKDR